MLALSNGKRRKRVDWKPKPDQTEDLRRSSVSFRGSTWDRVAEALDELRAEPGYSGWTRDRLLEHWIGIALDARDAAKRKAAEAGKGGAK